MAMPTPPNARTCRRLVTVLSVADGVPIDQIAWVLRVNRVGIYNWLKHYTEARDPASLADRYHGSKPVGWTDEVAAELKEAMASTWSGSPRGSTSPSSAGRYTGSSCTTRTPTGTPSTRANCRRS